MTEANWSQLIAMLGVVAIPGIVNCYLSWISYKKSVLNNVALKGLEVTVDGRLTQLIDANRRADRAEGRQDEVERVRDINTMPTHAPEQRP